MGDINAILLRPKYRLSLLDTLNLPMLAAPLIVRGRVAHKVELINGFTALLERLHRLLVHAHIHNLAVFVDANRVASLFLAAGCAIHHEQCLETPICLALRIDLINLLFVSSLCSLVDKLRRLDHEASMVLRHRPYLNLS